MRQYGKRAAEEATRRSERDEAKKNQKKPARTALRLQMNYEEGVYRELRNNRLVLTQNNTDVKGLSPSQIKRVRRIASAHEVERIITPSK